MLKEERPNPTIFSVGAIFVLHGGTTDRVIDGAPLPIASASGC